MLGNAHADARFRLYRLLGDPVRSRLLALASFEELSVGELAELLGEAQPNVSRHAGPLRLAGLLVDRRHGTRTFVRASPTAGSDPVVADAIEAGRRLCVADGSLERVSAVVRERDARTREFFAQPGSVPIGEVAPELPAYLRAVGALVAGRDLAIDAGAGDGRLLDAIAPMYRRVIALDRSEARLAQARERVRVRGYANVELSCGEVDGPEIVAAAGGGADAVFAARMLHHSPLPRATVAALAGLLRPGGQLVVVDYERHDDERLKDEQADVWMGFGADELRDFARSAGLVDADVSAIPRGFSQNGVDGHVPWQLLLATRPVGAAPSQRAARKVKDHGTERSG